MHDEFATRGTAESLLERGRLLLVRHRLEDAEKCFREALAMDPTNVFALSLLARCLHAADGREAEAVEVLDRALALEPEEGWLHAQRAIVLCALKRLKEAQASADQAIALDPFDSTAHAAKGLAYLRESRWSEAERCAREGLELDADDALAQNVLTQSLLWQGRKDESEEDIRARLARDPEDAFTHYNAGYAALKRDDYKQAETHFLEALRLDPEFDPAREGLLESFRARNAIYRLHLRQAFAMAQLTERTRIGVAIGAYLVYRVVAAGADKIAPLAGTAVALLYFLFVTWGYVARGVGSFLVLTDPRARQALRGRETVEAVAVGGGVIGGLLLVVLGFVFGWALAIFGGFGLLACAIPVALYLTVTNRLGRVLYGTMAAVIVVAALTAFGALLLKSGSPDGSATFVTALQTAAGALFVTTLAAAFGVKRD